MTNIEIITSHIGIFLERTEIYQLYFLINLKYEKCWYTFKVKLIYNYVIVINA